jgi:hypothetical protein
VELTHSDLNPIFDMCVVFMTNYSFRGSRHPRRQRVTLGDRNQLSLLEVLIGVGCARVYS